MSMQSLNDQRPGGTVAWQWVSLPGIALLVLGGVIAWCVWTLESRFAGLSVQHVTLEDTPVTLYRPAGQGALPPVIVAHGFAGSRQMMDRVAVSVARQGFLVASVDLPGHGRNEAQMSPDINRIEGTTAQLVDVVARVTETVIARADTTVPVSYIGHSMATDIVIRAASVQDDVGGVVAISMYSPAVTETHPRALLVVSGARESHLRAAGVAAVQQVAEAASEGETVTQGQITRRTVVAPYVGHVGVLFAPSTLDETTSWLRQVLGQGRAAQLDVTGWVAGLLLVCLILLAWPLAFWLPKRENDAPSLTWRSFGLCLLAPMPLVLLAALLPVFGIAGNAAVGTLGLLLGLWGCTQMILLYRAGVRFGGFDALGLLAYLALGLGVFAVALDRYGAAFLPSGERMIVMLGLMLGTTPAMLADTALVQGASVLRRILARLALLGGLSGAIALQPMDLGLAFTTLPILVLFFLVYGTIGRWVSLRRGAEGAAWGKAVALAWALAASTPLFALSAAL